MSSIMTRNLDAETKYEHYEWQISRQESSTVEDRLVLDPKSGVYYEI